MTKPFTLNCPVCDFASPSADGFATHMIATGHSLSAEARRKAADGGSGYADLVASLESLMAMVQTGVVPPEAEVRALDIEEELLDPDVPEDAKEQMRAFQAKVEAEKKKQKP